MVTIKDVAKLADVSISTVSRVLNNKDKVSEDAKKAVLDAVRELNYQPNLLAKSLKTMKSYTVGFVVENITNPYFADIIKAVQEEAYKNGFNVLLCDSRRNDQRVISHLNSLKSKKVDGIIYCSGKNVSDQVKKEFLDLKESNMPIVLLGKSNLNLDVSNISTGDENAAYKIVTHLINLGHKNITFIGGIKDYLITSQRVEGYQEAMKKNALEENCQIYYGEYGDNIVKRAKEIGLEVLQKENRPSAIFGADDLIALGIELAAKTLEIKIPQDLAVVGFNNLQYSQYADPPITSIGFPRYEMGRLAFQNLHRQIEENNNQVDLLNIVFEGEMFIRASCGTYPNYKYDNIT